MILVVLCLIFSALFFLDGFINWPGHDDSMVHRMLHSNSVDTHYKVLLGGWPGWNHATMAQRHRFDHIVHMINFSGWHTVTDIENQRWIALFIGLLAVAGGVWWWRVHNRRISVDETGLTLDRQKLVTWSQIKRIDNRQWISQGIVDIEYQLADGRLQSYRFDSMTYDELGPLLNVVGEKSSGAEMLNPPDFLTQPT